MKPVFRPSDDGSGVTIIDPIQRRRFPLRTPEPIQPTTTTTDNFYFPADSATEIVAEKITLPYVVITHVRNETGDVLVSAEEYSYDHLPNGRYTIELNAPIKIQICAESELTVASSADRMEFDFGSNTRIQIGAQSYHDRPGTTITTTTSPHDVMAAISTFGWALKTTSCERSLPSFRGHPPRIERGEELHIPEGIAPPETDVYIEVPPVIKQIFPISTLAYYLGATVVPGDDARLVTDDGFTHRLESPTRGFEGEVERVLKQLFFLDCLTRTEGYYQIDLYERNIIEPEIDIQFETLYNKPLSEQIPIYLDVPFEKIQEHIPAWPLETHITAEEENIESLPYLCNNFSTIRVHDEVVEREQSASRRSMEGFLRGTKEKQRGADQSGYRSYVAPGPSQALEQAWLGSGKPVGANKVLKSGFEHRFDRPSSTEGIDITVVCNEEEMSSEYEEGDELYGERDELEFDIDVHWNVSVAELKQILTSQTDFLHYIGHIEDYKFVCRDGGLDVRTLDEVAVDTFLLNGCRSYDQGKQLIQAGSISGIVTYNDIGNDSATSVGQIIARLLNRGFSIRSALTITRDRQLVGNDYLVIGDGSVEITQSESGTPVLCEIAPHKNEDMYTVNISTYPTVTQGLGSVFRPYIKSNSSYFITGGELPTFNLSLDSLAHFLRLEQIPVAIKDSIVLSTEIELSRL